MLQYMSERKKRTDGRKKRNKKRKSAPMGDLLNDFDDAMEEVKAQPMR